MQRLWERLKQFNTLRDARFEDADFDCNAHMAQKQLRQFC